MIGRDGKRHALWPTGAKKEEKGQLNRISRHSHPPSVCPRLTVSFFLSLTARGQLFLVLTQYRVNRGERERAKKRQRGQQWMPARSGLNCSQWSHNMSIP
jgi:hypothetical protein